ncbi:hypothetical protein DPMN_001177 [Dreissena polymorpha]|uniref:Liprin-beta-1/2 coiled-coil domain-containing protein n=1 Tax=Dreissena polymorpha TaxID=45954 RepID=A0A9D4MKH0_DREPO|nr:hypothetical protein DPMN_001177 [Dreissena polymorpha]
MLVETKHLFGLLQGPEERARRLEMDRSSLTMQVNVLTEQVEAQSERIREMEYQLENRRQKVQFTEERYQKSPLHGIKLQADVSVFSLPGGLVSSMLLFLCNEKQERYKVAVTKYCHCCDSEYMKQFGIPDTSLEDAYRWIRFCINDDDDKDDDDDYDDHDDHDD